MNIIINYDHSSCDATSAMYKATLRRKVCFEHSTLLLVGQNETLVVKNNRTKVPNNNHAPYRAWQTRQKQENNQHVLLHGAETIVIN